MGSREAEARNQELMQQRRQRPPGRRAGPGAGTLAVVCLCHLMPVRLLGAGRSLVVSDRPAAGAPLGNLRLDVHYEPLQCLVVVRRGKVEQDIREAELSVGLNALD